MRFDELAARAAQMGVAGTPAVPPPEVVGVVVRSERTLLGWKVAALASLAGVSVSTVERIERGEKISDEALDRVAQAFGHEPGYYTWERKPIPMEDAVTDTAAVLAKTIPVRVRPLKGERAVREIRACQGFMIHHARVDARFAGEIELLRDWCEWAGQLSNAPRSRGRRPRYFRLLQVIEALRSNGLDLMAGTIPPEQTGVLGWNVAVICVTRRGSDPGASKRGLVQVSPQLAAMTASAGPSGIRFARRDHD